MFDLGTKEGRLVFAVLAAAAEYELELRGGRRRHGAEWHLFMTSSPGCAATINIPAGQHRCGARGAALSSA
jgi:hypothetical protein